MPYLSFIHPAALWLLLLLLPLWALALLTPRRLSPLRFWSSLGLRTLLTLLLVLSLAGAQLVHGVDQLTTVFVLDSSDSISPSARGRAETFVQEALRSKTAQDQAALVVFGENALVERAPNTSSLLQRIWSQPVVARTNIEEALQLGLALFPADTQKRLVLLSDGGENTGDALQAARLALGRNVPIDVVDLSVSATDSDEAFLAALQAPAHVRDGQEIELLAMVESTIDQPARLRIFADQEIVVDREVQLAAGSNQFRATVRAEGQGFRHYRATIEPQQDNRLQNNEAAALVEVQGPPRVLLVEGQPGEAAMLLQALQAANINAEIQPPEAMPTDLTGLSSYEAVVLVNVPARELSVQTIAALPAYVRDLGRGLVMIGGDASYGVGGYGKTPIEEALPVYMDVRDRQERPDLALIFAIDKSGSMDACHCSGPNRSMAQLSQSGERKIDIAKEAVTQASALLGVHDTLGVVTFDNSAQLALPATEGVLPDEVASAMADIRPVGSTNVRAGLLQAEQILQQTDARIKHVVLLTDGWGDGGKNLDIAARMRENGITLSVVAAGSGSATFLESLAASGGGRYYPVEDMADVPQIFLQETIVAAGNYIVERPFIPAVAAESPVLADLDAGLPPLYGYNGTTLKDTARSLLITDDQSPLLAQWQYGLGRSAAWTSDLRGQWARDWMQWEQFPRFAAQMIHWVLPGNNSQNIDTSFEIAGAQTTLTARIQDAQGVPREDVQVTAALIRSRADQSSTSQPDEPLEMEMQQIAPGEYHINVPTPDAGTYLVQIRARQEGRDAMHHVSGLVVPYSAEYSQHQGNPELLQRLAALTEGSPLSTPDMAFAQNVQRVTRAQEIALPLLLLALLLLPLDIAARRLLLHRRDMHALYGWLQARVLPAAAPAADQAARTSAMERLAQAKRRATSAQTHTTTASTPPPAVPHAPPHKAPPPASTPPADTASTPPPTTAASDPLERLRQAKQRARRRARGEE